MATANLPRMLTVEQYLNTTYRPDVDSVDGEIEERNLGEFGHGDLQLTTGSLLRLRQAEWNVRIVTETRVQTAPTRYRIPDVCVTPAASPRERIIRTAPLLSVEVLSPRDILKAIRRRVQDFFDMGVPTVDTRPINPRSLHRHRRSHDRANHRYPPRRGHSYRTRCRRHLRHA